MITPRDTAILKIIRPHRGKDNGITVAQIQDALGVEGDSYAIRHTIKRLVEVHGIAIGCHPDHGVFMISSREEVDLVNRNLLQRANSITRRAALLSDAFDNVAA